MAWPEGISHGIEVLSVSVRCGLCTLDDPVTGSTLRPDDVSKLFVSAKATWPVVDTFDRAWGLAD